jgi:hypothetical protein
LKELNLEADICKTEDEARQKALLLDEKSNTWPVFFFDSDTSGEKSFEEFFTEEEIRDENTFMHLGVVKNSKKRDLNEINTIFAQLNNLFDSKVVTKAKIVEILHKYLPNFEHIETGKGLDSKM